jgi:hypothetical protein
MFSVVKVQPHLVRGDVVAFDPSQGVFAPSSSLATPLGVLSEDAQEAQSFNVETQAYEPLGYHVAPVSFAGVAFARCSRDVPDEGGELMVENGKVYVDNNADGAGIICPLPHDQSSRLAGDLVMVHIR